MKEKRTEREISNRAARAGMWLSVAWLAPMGCWLVYAGFRNKDWGLLMWGVVHLALALLFFAGLTSNKRTE